MTQNKQPKLTLCSKKKSTTNSIGKFLTKPQVISENVPLTRKRAAAIEEVPEVWESSEDDLPALNDSDKYFETTKNKIKSITRTKETKGTVVSKFFKKSEKPTENESKSVNQKKSVKTKLAAFKKVPKNQPKIKNVINKREEEIFQKFVKHDCDGTGVDPEELQLAIALSKSMSEQEHESHGSTTEKFQNPFNSKTNKIKNFKKVLEQYGFKCKNSYADYDLAALVNTNKKPKWSKRPTELTLRTQNVRDTLTEARVNRVLKYGVLESPNISEPRLIYEVSSFLLNDYHDPRKTLFRKSIEEEHTDITLRSYFVDELFEPSYVKSGALLKDWSNIPGREATPEKEIAEVVEEPITKVSEDLKMECLSIPKSQQLDVDEDNKENQSSNSTLNYDYASVSDIFADSENSAENLSPTSVVKETTQICNSIEEFDKFSSDDDDERIISKRRSLQGVEIIHLSSDEEVFSPLTQAKPIPKDDDILTNQADSIQSTDNIVEQYPIKLDQATATTKVNLLWDSIDEVELVASTVVEEKNKVDESIPITQDDPIPKYQELFENLSQQQSEIISLSSEDLNSQQKCIGEIPPLEIVSSPATKKSLPWDSIDEDDLIAATVGSPEILIDPKVSNARISYDLIQDENDVDIFLDEISPRKSQTYPSMSQKRRCNSQSDDELLTQHSQISQLSQQSQASNSNESIVISDEEVNYSIRNHRRENDSDIEEIQYELSQTSDVELAEQAEEHAEEDTSDIINLCDESLVDILDKEQPEDIHINSSVAHLLNMSEVKDHKHFIKQEDNPVTSLLSISIQELLANYEKDVQEGAGLRNRRSTLKRIHSDSGLKLGENEDVPEMDLNQSCFGRFSRSPSAPREYQNYEEDIEHQYFATPSPKKNKISAPLAISPRKEKSFTGKFQQLQNYGISSNPNYIVDTSSAPPMPDYKKMDALTLKFELNKIGVRALTVKRSVELLEFIWKRQHPEIRIMLDTDDVVNESRRMFNATDLLPNINVHDKDEFVFKPEMEDEEYILAKIKRGKNKSCSVPLHIAFYNMVRSNEQLQSNILQFRPIDLDKVSRHFKAIELSYQSNDLIAFLDKRCITFKTEQNSYSNIHERKKLKRTQSTQARRK